MAVVAPTVVVGPDVTPEVEGPTEVVGPPEVVGPVVDGPEVLPPVVAEWLLAC